MSAYDDEACPCPACDGHEHEWGPEREATATHGPLEGEWIVQCCLWCNAFSLRPADGGDGFDNVIAALDAAGCEPRPAR
jgi:hypothetical protein